MNLLLALLALVALALALFLILPAKALSVGLKRAIPLLMMAAGGVLILTGRVGIGGALVFGGFVMWRRSATVGSFGGGQGGLGGQGPQSGQSHSTVRSAALEMELNHTTGEMNGVVLAGRHEGSELDRMAMEDLVAFADEIRDDGESMALLEAYLDRRSPGWREDAEFDPGPGERSAPRSGTMGEEEAYEILGLAPGASREDIQAAHRRLLKGMHPDRGGSTFLAAKINEAKDVLLKRHS